MAGLGFVGTDSCADFQDCSWAGGDRSAEPWGLRLCDLRRGLWIGASLRLVASEILGVAVRNGVPWTDADKRFLRRWWMKTPASNIGVGLGRSKNSVIGEARRLGLPRHETGRTKDVRRFTAEEDAQIRALRAEGFGPPTIGRQIGRHRGSVRNRLITLGLAGKVGA